MLCEMPPRTVRLFLSSTFRDFGEERDLLVKRVFPALRARLKDRFVELVDVDLRWGITAAEAERGEVLPICLAEIDRARPYFIGMLGERYGWIPPPDGYAADLLERRPWLKKHQGGKSVTELEILHGVLNNRSMRGRAFFYFRSPAYARTKGGDYLPSAEDRTRQTELKRRIRERGLPVTAYANPEALAKRLERDLWKLLDAEFPASEVPDAYDRERLRHEAYAASRRRLYLGGERYQAVLNKLLDTEEPRILVEGVSGSGKSALLANFFAAYRKRRPRHLVHEHYLGASTDAAHPHALVRRLIEFIQRATDSTDEIPGDPQKLMDSLPIWLATASAWARKRRTRFIFVLDSLNSLTDQQDLRWWPAFLPKGVTMLVSCLSGLVMDALKGKSAVLPSQDKPPKWKTVTVRPMTKAQSATLLNTYLARFNKKLPRQMVKQVQAHPLATNPLFLRTLAEELRLFGIHEELQKRLYHYLASQTIDDLFERVLQRVEKDCGKKQVKAALTAIWASRAGLTEKEILGIAEIAPSAWAAMRHALDEALLDTGGKITFAHEYARTGVMDRYLGVRTTRRHIHTRLAQWFKVRATDARRSEEEPYQWQQSKSWSELKACLTDLRMFKALYEHVGKEQLWSYWLVLEKNTQCRALKEYEFAWTQWQKKRRAALDDGRDLAFQLADILNFGGHYGLFTERLYRGSIRYSSRRFKSAHPITAYSNANLAELMRIRGDYAKAEPLFKKALSIVKRALGSRHLETATCLSQLGSLLLDQGNLDSAERFLRQALEIAEKVCGVNHQDTCSHLNQLGSLLLVKNNLVASEDLLSKALWIAKRVYGSSHPSTGTSLHNLASVLHKMENYLGAETLYREALAIDEKYLGPMHPKTAASLLMLGLLLKHKGNYKEAEQSYIRALKITKWNFGEYHPEVGKILNNLGALAFARGDLRSAAGVLHNSLEVTQLALGSNHWETANCLYNLAETYTEQGKYDLAKPLYQRALVTYENTLGLEHPDTTRTLYCLGNLLLELKEITQAEIFLRREIAILRKTDGPDSLSLLSSLKNLGVALRNAGELEKSEPFLVEALEMAERIHIDQPLKLSSALIAVGKLRLLQKRYSESKELIEKCLEIRLMNLPKGDPRIGDTKALLKSVDLGRVRRVRTPEPLKKDV